MSGKMRKILSAALICLLTVCFVCAAVAETEPLLIKVELDKTSVKVGEAVTATYEITGGNGEYSHIGTLWSIDTGTEDAKVNHQYPKEAKGSITFTPRFGKSVYFFITVEDSDGRQQSAYSKEIEITGSTVTPKLKIEVSLDKSSVKVGEPVTASYEITGGNGEYSRIGTLWSIDTGTEDAKVNHQYPKEAKGSITFTPRFGKSVYFFITVEDSDGRQQSVYSKEIEIENRTVTPTPTPTAKPTAMPTAKPTATPTATPVPGYDGGIVDGETAFDKLPPVKVPTLILPDGTIEELDLTLKFDGPNKGNGSVKYDVRLVDSEGNKVELPGECILCFPYPEGLDETTDNRYRIMIHHLGDKGMEKFDTKDGSIELRAQGLCIRVSSLSPFEISWEEIEIPENLPQTGDDSSILLHGMLLMLSAVVLIAMRRKMKRA